MRAGIGRGFQDHEKDERNHRGHHGAEDDSQMHRQDTQVWIEHDGAKIWFLVFEVAVDVVAVGKTVRAEESEYYK